jgi:hypothetical protein
MEVILMAIMEKKQRAILYGDTHSMVVRTEEEIQETVEQHVRINNAPFQHKGWFYNTDTSGFGIMSGIFVPDDDFFVATIHDGEAYYEKYRTIV